MRRKGSGSQNLSDKEATSANRADHVADPVDGIQECAFWLRNSLALNGLAGCRSCAEVLRHTRYGCNQCRADEQHESQSTEILLRPPCCIHEPLDYETCFPDGIPSRQDSATGPSFDQMLPLLGRFSAFSFSSLGSRATFVCALQTQADRTRSEAGEHTDPFTLQCVAGHDNIKTTMRYVHPQANAVQKLFARLATLQHERPAAKSSMQR